MANPYSQPFCDFLERYQAAFKPKWANTQLRSQRVNLRKFDAWLKVTPYKLHELNWQKLLEFYQFVSAQGVSPRACEKCVQTAKHVIRWGIENGELPQKLEDIYTYQYSRNKWNKNLPELSTDFLSELEPTRPSSFRAHRNTHRIFHTFRHNNDIAVVSLS